MEPINQKDINSTFVKFLAIFLATIGLIIGAVYYDSFIPKKEMAKLKAIKQNFDVEKEYQLEFNQKLKEINLYFDSVDSSNSESYNFDYLVGLKIAEMEQSVEYRKKQILESDKLDLFEKTTDSTRLAMYSEIVRGLKILHKTQLENISMKRMIKPMENYKNANEKYQQEYDRLQGELTKCQAMILELYNKNNVSKP